MKMDLHRDSDHGKKRAIKTSRPIMSWVFLVIGTSLIGCANPEISLTGAERERIESYAQDIIQPIVRGVAFDPTARNAYYSACPRREYACDLYRVDFTLAAPRAAVFHTSSTYGYVWPALSPDGSRLAAVRVRRSERLSDRNENQDLVEIDLATGTERVLTNAQGGRFTRVEYLADDLIALVRTYRSSPSFVCRGDLCTDRGEVLLLDRGTVTTLPMRTIANHGAVTFLPLSTQRLWLVGTARSTEVESPQSAYIIDLNNRGRNRSFALWREAIDYVEGEYGRVVEWDGAIVRNGSLRTEELPFYRQLPLWLWTLEQTHLVSASLAVGLEKRHDGRFVFQICENRGRIPWSCSATQFQGPQ